MNAIIGCLRGVGVDVENNPRCACLASHYRPQQFNHRILPWTRVGFDPRPQRIEQPLYLVLLVVIYWIEWYNNRYLNFPF